MPLDQPIFILQSPPDSGRIRRLSPDELPGVAEHYVEKMRGLQADGPYYLLGMCTGAQIALEMGRQLESKGVKTAFLGLVNTWGFYTISRLYYFTRFVNRMKWRKKRFRELLEAGPRSQLAFVSGKLQRYISVFSTPAVTAGVDTNSSSHLGSYSSNSGVSKSVVADQDVSWIESVGWVWMEPKTTRYQGEVTVFRIRKQPYWRIKDSTLGWNKQSQQVAVEEMPGSDHEAIMREPAIQDFAGRLNRLLAESRS